MSSEYSRRASGIGQHVVVDTKAAHKRRVGKGRNSSYVQRSQVTQSKPLAPTPLSSQTLVDVDDETDRGDEVSDRIRFPFDLIKIRFPHSELCHHPGLASTPISDQRRFGLRIPDAV
jgi:hypothetical protein